MLEVECFKIKFKWKIIFYKNFFVVVKFLFYDKYFFFCDFLGGKFS